MDGAKEDDGWKRKALKQRLKTAWREINPQYDTCNSGKKNEKFMLDWGHFVNFDKFERIMVEQSCHIIYQTNNTPRRHIWHYWSNVPHLFVYHIVLFQHLPMWLIPGRTTNQINSHWLVWTNMTLELMDVLMQMQMSSFYCLVHFLCMNH